MSSTADRRATIRQATPADAQAILVLEQACFDDAHERFGLSQIRGLIGNPRATVVVAWHPVESAILGWGAGLVRRHCTGATGRVYAIAVAPSAQGLGLGWTMMEHLLAKFASHGVRRVYLEVRADNIPAIALYRKLGFVDHADLRHYYRPGRHALRMRRDEAEAK